jgi:hypothetical protein
MLPRTHEATTVKLLILRFHQLTLQHSELNIVDTLHPVATLARLHFILWQHRLC